MNKVDNVSFTGIKNIASIKLTRSGCKPFKNLSLTLCNDANGNELQEFNDVLNRIGEQTSSSILNEKMPEALNIECLELLTGKKYLYVNGTILEETDRDLPLFSFIAKITKKVSKMREKDMVIDDKYKKFDARNNLLYDAECQNYDDLYEDGSADTFFNKRIVRNSSKKINEFIVDIMNSYFGVK
jgi:hypothetical protein